MIAISNPAGRLVAMRIAWPVSPQELQQSMGTLVSVLGALPGTAVACVDVRQADVFTKPIADGFLAMMKADNPKIERSGFAVGERAVLSMQVERVVREAGHPHRKTFRDMLQLQSFLGEIMTADERGALAKFIAEVP